jgi:DNA transformation protein and related proteins
MDAGSIADIFADFGPVRVRRVFGGHGVYADGIVFALELRGEIFLKADAESEAAFAAMGSSPFTYQRRSSGKSTTLPYWRMPETAFDDPDELRRWCGLALDAARRAALRKPAASVRRPRAARKAGSMPSRSR